ncbi:hypothetical protein [Vulcanococcus limneticus]|uniref:hypothetical protein n=1 Tax=Vulcanococcus limneticus TaxID=2170428 RepID=UPI00398C0A9A
MDLDAPSDPAGNGTASDAGSPRPSPADAASDEERAFDARPERPLTATLLLDRFEALLPAIQREWPEVARHTLEASRGSLDRLVEVIARQTGRTSEGIKVQLVELIQATGDSAHQVSDSLRPLEQQLEHLLDELHTTLRPKIEKPVRERPLLALAVAAGVGLLTGLLLTSARRRP